jgi:hypothetical protein
MHEEIEVVEHDEFDDILMIQMFENLIYPIDLDEIDEIIDDEVDDD